MTTNLSSSWEAPTLFFFTILQFLKPLYMMFNLKARNMMKTIQVVLMIALLVAWCAFEVPEQRTIITKEKGVEVNYEQTTSKKSKRVGYLMVRTTYYNPTEAQCDSDPLITADGSKIDLRKLKNGNLRWIAISRDLLVEYPLGTKVKITSEKYPKISGVYVIHDVMNSRFRYSIDILSHTDHGHIFGTHLTKLEKV